MLFRSLLAAIISMSLSGSIFAADVPVGTKLADVQEITINNGSEPQSFDPHKTEGTPESQVLFQILEGLITKDAEGNLQAGIAERWESTPDFKTWTFHLRKNAQWTNGDPVTAKDFVFAWRRLADPKTAAPYASYLGYLQIENAEAVMTGKKKPEELGVEARDDYTFVIHLSNPLPYAPNLTTHQSLLPVNHNAIEKFGEDWVKPENYVGNGAYKLAQHVINEKIVFERNPSYWNDKKTVINKATFLAIENSPADVARYRSGEEDITTSLSQEQFVKAKKEIPDELLVSQVLATYVYQFNLARPPFNDIRVRKALNLLLDRHIITDKVLKQGQKPTYVYTPTYITDGGLIQQPEYSKLDQATRNAEGVKLLEEAGYSKANPLKFTLLYNTSESHKKIAIAVASIFKQNSDNIVNVELKNQEWKTFLDTRRHKNFELSRETWMADYNQASTFINNYLSNSSHNSSSYNSKAYDEAVAQSLSVNANTRQQAYAKAEKILADDAALLPVHNPVNTRLVKPYVGGYEGKDPRDDIFLRNLYIIQH